MRCLKAGAKRVMLGGGGRRMKGVHENAQNFDSNFFFKFWLGARPVGIEGKSLQNDIKSE